MSVVTAVGAAITALLGIVGVLGVCVVWLRRSISTERDEARVNTNAALKELHDIEDRIGEARLAERDDWIGRLERHHATAHRRCESGPERDG